MPFFQSEDAALAEYNGKHVTELSRWTEGYETADGLDMWKVVEVQFDDGTIFTCSPSEVRDVHPYAEQFRCAECGDLALYRTDHKITCSVHPDYEFYQQGKHYHTDPN